MKACTNPPHDWGKCGRPYSALIASLCFRASSLGRFGDSSGLRPGMATAATAIRESAATGETALVPREDREDEAPDTAEEVAPAAELAVLGSEPTTLETPAEAGLDDSPSPPSPRRETE